ncbi:hypothetical protein N7491_007674 [Penicillium cf. griseofulvum]|nr:hypothetical protein N7491_007674 [Penicillium cf. griseofulvum]
MESIYKIAENGKLTDRDLEGKGPNEINKVNYKSKLTPLGIAVWNGHVKTINLLLKRGANANGTADTRPPLWVAAAKTNYRAAHIVQILLKNGADPNQRSLIDKNTTPLIEAVGSGDFPEVVSLLVDAGAKCHELVDDRGRTAQEIAEAKKDREILQALLPRSERTRSRVDATGLVVCLVLGVVFLVNRNPMFKVAIAAGGAVIYASRNAIKERFDMTGAFEKRVPKKLDSFFPPGDPFLQKVVKNSVRLKRDPDNTASPHDLARLALYQPVLYCDDSGSMTEGGRRDAQNNIVQRITSITTKIVPDEGGIILRFINAETRPDMNKPSEEQINTIMTNLSLDGWTPIGTNLSSKVIEDCVYKPLKEDRLKRPVLVSITTDGQPSKESPDTLKNAILDCGKTLEKHKFNRNVVRFQISQIGVDAQAEDFLNSLDDDPELENVLYRTAERLDKEFEDLRQKDSELEAWLLKLLMGPIVDAGDYY